MSLSYRLVGFDDVSWKTAQNTGALAYMPYARAQEYAGIYSLQDETRYSAEARRSRRHPRHRSLSNADDTDPARAAVGKTKTSKAAH